MDDCKAEENLWPEHCQPVVHPLLLARFYIIVTVVLPIKLLSSYTSRMLLPQSFSYRCFNLTPVFLDRCNPGIRADEKISRYCFYSIIGCNLRT